MARRKIRRRRVIDLLKYSPMFSDYEVARLRLGLFIYGGVTWIMNLISWHFIYLDRVRSWYSGSTIEEDPCFPQTWYHMLLDIGTWNITITGIKWGCCAILTLRPTWERLNVAKVRKYIEVVEQFSLPLVLTSSVFHWSVRLRWIRMNGFEVPAVGYVVMGNTFAVFPLVCMAETWVGKVPFEHANWWLLFAGLTVYIALVALYSLGSGGCWLIPSLNPRVNIPWLSYPGYYFMYAVGYVSSFVFYQLRDHGAMWGQIALPPYKYNLKNTAGRHINPMEQVNQKLKAMPSASSLSPRVSSQGHSARSSNSEEVEEHPTLFGALLARRFAKNLKKKRVVPEGVQPERPGTAPRDESPRLDSVEIEEERFVEPEPSLDDHSARRSEESGRVSSRHSSEEDSPRIDHLIFGAALTGPSLSNSEVVPKRERNGSKRDSLLNRGAVTNRERNGSKRGSVLNSGAATSRERNGSKRGSVLNSGVVTNRERNGSKRDSVLNSGAVTNRERNGSKRDSVPNSGTERIPQSEHKGINRRKIPAPISIPSALDSRTSTTSNKPTPQSGRQILKPLPKTPRHKFQQDIPVPSLQVPRLLLPGDLIGNLSENSDSSEDAY